MAPKRRSKSSISQEESSAKKPKLQKEKLQGQPASTQPGTRFLVSRLPLFVTDGELKEEFGKYGEIISIDFIHRTDRSYTLSCVVEIVPHSVEAALRLINTQHSFNDLWVNVELCIGNGHRVLEKGMHELEIHHVKVIGSWNTNGEMIYTMLEDMVHCCSYSEMELKKSSIHKYTWEVVIFFHTESGREQAKEIIQKSFPRWVVQQ